MIKSILAAECGSTTTTAILIEKVDQTFRLAATAQAPSTYRSPWNDITLGVQEAVKHIENLVKRTLLTPGGWPITPQNPARQGVDAFLVICSAGEPLQMLVAGLAHDISVRSARQAAAGTYANVSQVISLDDGPHTPEERIQLIRTAPPDAILLAGGIDGGATRPVLEMGQAIATALQLLDENPPPVLYAGNRELRPQMADILGPLTALHSVHNVRPMLDADNLLEAQQILEQKYIRQNMPRLAGFDKLKNWSQYDVLPAYKSFEKLVAFVGQQNLLNVLGANIGSRSTVVVTQTQARLHTTVRSDMGLGQSLASLLEQIPIEQIHRWLPFSLTPEDLKNQLLTKCLYPNTIPTSPEDLMIEHAVAREALRLVAQQAQQDQPERLWNVIIGAGRPLTGAPQAAHAALVLLDGVEPGGVTSLFLDKSGAVDLLGTIAAVEPVAAVQVAVQDTFLNLGTVIAPAGYGRPGQTAMKIKVTFENGDIEERTVKLGALEVIPLAAQQKATVEIRPTRAFDIGLGQPGRGATAEVEGGLLGIILDARGRPIQLHADDQQRQRQIQQWLKALSISYAPPVN